MIKIYLPYDKTNIANNLKQLWRRFLQLTLSNNVLILYAIFIE